MSPTDYDKEVQAVMADLDHKGGIKRHAERLVQYIDQSNEEGAWPQTWDEFKHDFAIFVVEIRRMGFIEEDEPEDTNREGQPEFNGAFGVIDA